MNQELITRQTTYLLPQKSKVIHVGALRGLSERFILHIFQGLTCGPIFDVVTIWQQGDWCIMADISKIRINSLIVPNFVIKVEQTL